MSQLPFAQKAVNLSVVSYTHNDNELLAEALASIASWTVTPQEIIVVDDASNTPFVPSCLHYPLPTIKLLRSSTNLGYAKAKALGINSATKRFILSFDADVRLSPTWLALCLPTAAQRDIGLVSGPIISKTGSGLFHSYMELTYSLNTSVKGEVKFIPGAAWLIRRDVWQETGGFTDYSGNAGEDEFLCRKLENRGYKLWIDQEAQSFEVRPMDRFKMALRGWEWHGASVKTAIAEGRSLKEAANVLIYSMRARFARSLATNVRFLYYDLLYLSHALFDLLESIGAIDICFEFQNLLILWLVPYPQLMAALVKDLEVLGHEFSLPQDDLERMDFARRINRLNCITKKNELETALEFTFTPQVLTQLNTYIYEIIL